MRILKVTVAVALLAAGLSACTSHKADVTVTQAPDNAAGTAYHGLVRTPPAAKPDFTLVDTKGKAFDFVKATKGVPTLIYFGYTRCPDECPTTLHDLHAALRLVDAGIRKRVRVYFVTTDPKRDIPVVLSHYLQQFDDTFIGLSGTEQQIAAAESALKLPVAAADPSATLPSGGGYSVNHASVVVAFDTANQNPVLYPSGTTVDTYAADIPLLAKESS